MLKNEFVISLFTLLSKGKESTLLCLPLSRKGRVRWSAALVKAWSEGITRGWAAFRRGIKAKPETRPKPNNQSTRAGKSAGWVGFEHLSTLRAWFPASGWLFDSKLMLLVFLFCFFFNVTK